jgi:hypothetical protein
MREGGVDIPPLNSSGSGPVFNTAGLNKHSRQYLATLSGCQGYLLAASRLGKSTSAGAG